MVLKEHMEELHRISNLLIERETIDKEQFLRLLAGDPKRTSSPTRRRAGRAERQARRRAAPRTEAPAVPDPRRDHAAAGGAGAA